MTQNWLPFYDPQLYARKVGPGKRVEEFYRRLVGCKPLTCLDLGCGTGEIACALASDGHIVTGVDVSAGMLSQARENSSTLPAPVASRITWVEQDIRALNLETRFDCVLLANELITHILQGSELIALFSTCMRHLHQGGRILLDSPRLQFLVLARGTEPDGVHLVHGVFPFGENMSVWVAEQIRFDTDKYRTTKVFEYKYIGADGTVERNCFRTLVQRAWTLQEAEWALVLAGATLVTRSDVEDDASRDFLVAQR